MLFFSVRPSSSLFQPHLFLHIFAPFRYDVLRQQLRAFFLLYRIAEDKPDVDVAGVDVAGVDVVMGVDVVGVDVAGVDVVQGVDVVGVDVVGR